jgi:RNA polymerase nonessential primary-like sigma factor
VVKELNTYLRASRELTQALNHEPIPEEIANYLGKPVKQVSAVLNLNDRVGSVDNTLGPNSNTTLLESIPDTVNQDPEKFVVDTNLMSNMEQWLDRLSDLQKDVICHRFGLRGCSVSTLESLGKQMGLPRERVRQIQVGALRCLRHTLETEGLSSLDVLDAKL